MQAEARGYTAYGEMMNLIEDNEEINIVFEEWENGDRVYKLNFPTDEAICSITQDFCGIQCKGKIQEINHEAMLELEKALKPKRVS